ncbi:TAXI family TRAP transporter solute-binding subunit [Polynucleobacter kasalickyi]|uniref:TRAP-type uncharacterized transport system, substrate-binding protein n=1 Tax=Polynucleobacter kasalickyi TaxID=1938817 RepID=A0A1W1Y3M6_9BURK|nr:TAXI family TRAP transporter solute-binding subunit [Polynucleobacter kasalickyi]SMC30745.1 TRAP-type uncharacterized transport system, substrate-binding protein [Polynucleobacter kasalickyi]
MNFKTIVIIVIGFLVALVIGLTVIVPAPPKFIRIAAGSEDSSSFVTANRIKNEIEKYGIKVEIITTKGNLENVALLEKPKSSVSLAIIQSGTFKQVEHPELESIANLYLTPLLAIYRKDAFQKQPEFMRDFVGKNISIGPAEGNASLLFRQLTELSAAKGKFVTGVQKDYDILKSLQALERKQIDVLFVVERPDEEEELLAALKNPNFGIFNLTKAFAYPSRIKTSKVIEIPRATFSLQNNIPPNDIRTIGVSAELVAQKGINPAITGLLLDIIARTESPRSILQKEKEYPNDRELSFEQNEDSVRYFKNGPSFLNKYLPFWVAVWGDRLLKILIPILAVLIPVINFYPQIVAFRTKQKLHAIYKELHQIEHDVEMHHDKLSLTERLISVEMKATQLHLPELDTKSIFDLRENIQFVKAQLL